MNKNSSILLIVEGAKTERKLLEQIFKIYNIKVSDKQIYSYTTNIYSLYDRVFKNSLEELDDLDFLLALKENGINQEQNDILTEHDYSDILLIFDYEPQDDKFDISHLSIMMKYFSESTDNGKLYINYPSVESFKHFKSIPDPEYFNRYYKLADLINNERSQYKQTVGNESAITDIRKYTKSLLDYLVKENINKAFYIEKGNALCGIKETYTSLNEVELLSNINKMFVKDNIIPVLNTSLFFICEYNIRLIL